MERNNKSRKYSNSKAITLVALIITIIIMLILVGVSIQIVINSNLFGVAQNAGDKTSEAYKQEANISGITIGGKYYNSIDDYIERCDHAWGEWEVDTVEGNQERTCSKCDKVETKLIIGATIVGYDPSIAEDGTTINTTYQSLGEEGDGTIAGGSSGNGYSNQEFTVNSITEWKILGVENGQIIITTSTPINTDNGMGYKIRGQAGYLNFIDEINKISSIYGQGKYADTTLFPVGNGTVNGSGGRSITIEDIGYTVNSEPTTMIYTKDSLYGNINGGGDKTFNYWGEDALPSEGKEWRTLENGESVTLATYGYTEGTWTEKQENMIICDIDYYIPFAILAFGQDHTSYQTLSCCFGAIMPYYRSLYVSDGSGNDVDCSIRPAVYLRSDIEVSYNAETGVYTIME